MKLLLRIIRKLISIFKFYYQKFMMGVLYKNSSTPVLNDLTLFWVPGGMPLMLDVEASIAAALKLRGNKVHAIICDGVFTACVKREITENIPIENWKLACAACKKSCSSSLERMGIEHSFIGDYLSQNELQGLKAEAEKRSWKDISELEYKGVNVGKNAQSAILRYLKGYDFPNDERLVKEYAFSALVSGAASKKALESWQPQRVMMSHGCYVDWGPALHRALASNIPVISWMASYLTACFYIRHIKDGLRIDMHNISKEAWSNRAKIPLTQTENTRLDQFLNDRYTKNVSFDMKRFKAYAGQTEELKRKFNLSSSKPIWGMMTHINWDSVSDYSPMLYSSFNEWVMESIKIMMEQPQVQWIIKIHPAESWDNNPETGVEGLIKKNFPNLPDHIRIFSAEENISPMDFFQMIDGGITVYGTAGLEMALCGKPVILAGEAHYAEKGFTYDAHSKDEYANLIQKAVQIPYLSEQQRNWARQYAYLYFMQRQIPISVLKDPESKWWSFQFEKRHILCKGKDPAIDFICDRILKTEEFIMEEKLVESLAK